jgi:hypothetical protein
MPFYSIYSLALEQDLEQSSGMQQAATTLHNQTFLQPLMQRKHEHEKKRKEVKEQWYRAKRKLVSSLLVLFMQYVISLFILSLSHCHEVYRYTRFTVLRMI